MQGGVCWEQTIVGPTTGGKGSGFWHSPRPTMPIKMWPTPKVQDSKHGQLTEYEISRGEEYKTQHLHAMVMWPTPTGTERSGINPNTGKGAGLSHSVGGQLNPTWVEWLMGFPSGGPTQRLGKRTSPYLYGYGISETNAT